MKRLSKKAGFILKKKYILLISLFIINIQANDVMYEAIKNLNIEAVKKEITNKVYTKKQYEQFLDACNLSIKTWYDNTKYLSRSYKDLLLFILGITVVQVGGSMSYAAMKFGDTNKKTTPYKLGRYFAGLTGFGIGVSGIVGIGTAWNLPFANKNLKIACEIKRLVQDNAP